MTVDEVLAGGMDAATLVARALGPAHAWWRRRRRARPLFPLLLEIIYNIRVLNASQGLQPPRLLFSRRVWDFTSHTTALQHLPYEAFAVIATPYHHLDTLTIFFAEDPIGLVSARVRGEDQRSIEQLAVMFRAAEAALREHALHKVQLKRWIESDALRELHTPPTLQPLRSRTYGALNSLSPHDWSRLLSLISHLSRAYGGSRKG